MAADSHVGWSDRPYIDIQKVLLEANSREGLYHLPVWLRRLSARWTCGPIQ